MREFLLMLSAFTGILSIIPILCVLLPMFIYWDVNAVSAIQIRLSIAAWLIISLLVSAAAALNPSETKHYDY